MEFTKYIFDEYYKLDDNVQKQLYVRGSVQKIEIEHHAVGTSRSRPANYQFHLNLPNKTERVCFNFFCKTIQILKSTCYNWLKKATVGDLPHKLKGREGNRKVDKSEALNFLNSLPCYDSHYCRRKNTNKKYLDPGVTVAMLYRAYCLKCDEIINK